MSTEFSVPLGAAAPRYRVDRDADGIPDVADMAPGGGGAMPPPPPSPMASAAPAAEAAPREPNKPPPPIKLRTDFSALATFAPAVSTDAEGRATFAGLPVNASYQARASEAGEDLTTQAGDFLAAKSGSARGVPRAQCS